MKIVIECEDGVQLELVVRKHLGPEGQREHDFTEFHNLPDPVKNKLKKGVKKAYEDANK
jgi:hypothetical protein